VIAGATEAEWLAAILAAPDDVALRQVYGDWLQQRGDPRGELVTAQCRLHLGVPAQDRAALRQRERELLAEHELTWLAELGLEAGEGTFSCGMVEILRTTAERLRLHALRLSELTPVRGLRLERAAPPLGPSLRELRHLRFLVARGVRLGDEVLADLARTDPFRELTRLEASRNRITDAGARSLASMPSLRELTLLDVRDNRISAPGVRALAQSPHLAALGSLVLDHNPLGDAGVQALLSGPNLPALRHLSLVDARLGPQAARSLAAVPALGGLVSLDLAYNRIDTTGARALAESPHLRSLTRLRVVGNRLSGTAIGILRERFGAPEAEP
jgi:uncharacterized protein (TIGR02996 family)